MSYKSAIKRYIKIIDIIERNNFPTRDKLIEQMSEEGNTISVSTFKRDINALSVDFGCEIVYDSQKRGYFYDIENSTDINSFKRIIRLINTSEILQDTIRDNRENLKYLSFDNYSNFKGQELLPEILSCIKNHLLIQFSHYSYQKKSFTNYELKPYGLKEFSNRWYVVGVVNETEKIRTFGLDRIENFKDSKVKFKPNILINPLEEFQSVIGLIYSENKFEKVILSFSNFQGNYIKALPLHQSQKILEDTEHELLIELTLKPNIELIQKILSFGNEVRIIEPKWLVEELIQKLKKTLNNY